MPTFACSPQASEVPVFLFCKIKRDDEDAFGRSELSPSPARGSLSHLVHDLSSVWMESIATNPVSSAVMESNKPL